MFLWIIHFHDIYLEKNILHGRGID